MKQLINAAYVVAGIAVAWFIYTTIDYQLKRNACLGYHLNRLNEVRASQNSGLENGASVSPAESCRY